jgi:hypothetical protein
MEIKIYLIIVFHIEMVIYVTVKIVMDLPKSLSLDRMFSIIVSLGIIMVMAGVYMIKKKIVLPLPQFSVQPVGIMVIQMFSLVNMIMTIKGLWIKIY